MKKTLQEKLQARQGKLPNGLLYAILMLVVKILNGKIHTSFRFKADPRKDKKPFILISNHALISKHLTCFRHHVCVIKLGLQIISALLSC